MTLKEAIEVLKQHNNWRRGFDNDMPYLPSQIEEAIDTVIKAYEVTDDEITTWVGFRLPHKITDHEWESGERCGLIEGAKALRDGKIGGEK